jgi:hypothetical protein
MWNLKSFLHRQPDLTRLLRKIEERMGEATKDFSPEWVDKTKTLHSALSQHAEWSDQ